MSSAWRTRRREDDTARADRSKDRREVQQQHPREGTAPDATSVAWRLCGDQGGSDGRRGVKHASAKELRLVLKRRDMSIEERLHQALSRDPVWKCLTDDARTRLVDESVGALLNGSMGDVLWCFWNLEFSLRALLQRLRRQAQREGYTVYAMDLAVNPQPLSQSELAGSAFVHETSQLANALDLAAIEPMSSAFRPVVNRARRQRHILRGMRTQQKSQGSSPPYVSWFDAVIQEVGYTTGAMDIVGVASPCFRDLRKRVEEECSEWVAKIRNQTVTKWFQAKRFFTDYIYLKIVEWLRLNPTDGCPSWVLKSLAKSQQWDMLQWVLRERPRTKCSAEVLVAAAEQGELHVVKTLLEREELRSWPRPAHATSLVKLLQSDDALHYVTLNHIVRIRQERYHPDALDNPTYRKSRPYPVSNRRNQRFVLAGVSKVCRHRHIPREASEIVSRFIVNDPGELYDIKHAIHSGWIRWLLRFSKNPSADLELLVDFGYYVEACWLHNRLKRTKRLECSKHCMYKTVEKGDLMFVEWHMLHCKAHSLEDWMYAAVWIGRDDVISWMGLQRGVVSNLPRAISPKRKTLFHSVEASFAKVSEHFESELMEVEAWMNDEEAAAKIGEHFSGLSSNEMDLAAIYGNPHFLKKGSSFPESRISMLLAIPESQRGTVNVAKMEPGFAHTYKSAGDRRACCTVTGLYGAIVNGHLEIVRTIYKNQHEFAQWPRVEEGPVVLRRLLHPPNEDMLRFFRNERGMRLSPHELDQAAFLGNLARVKLIIDLELVDSMHINNAVDIAAVRGDSAMLFTLLRVKEDFDFTTRAMDGAAEEGHLRIIQILHKHGAPCTRRAVDFAARNGHLEVVRILLERHQAVCSEWAMYWASACGHGRVVQYLASKQVPFDIENCVAIARSQGHADIVDMLVSYRDAHGSALGHARHTSSSHRRRQCGIHYPEELDTTLSRVIYHDLERLAWPAGMLND